MANWHIYTGDGLPHDGISALPPPPPWRPRYDVDALPSPPPGLARDEQRAVSYRPTPEAVERVNAALILRRPLLVTGPPGVGKSTLAYAVARELRLGPVLYWPITSTSTLAHGLYSYDALGRVYSAERDGTADDIGDYVRLGPLGTALLPHDRPRVLLIDEADKSDIDLPNDLLNVLEQGSYEILELARLSTPQVKVMTADDTVGRVPVTGGVVRVREFPLVILTSNGEREFPPAFLRRCVRLDLPQPATEDALAEIVTAHLGQDYTARSRDLIREFLDRRSVGTLATDQLLNAVYLLHHANPPSGRAELARTMMPYIGRIEFEDVADRDV